MKRTLKIASFCAASALALAAGFLGIRGRACKAPPRHAGSGRLV